MLYEIMKRAIWIMAISPSGLLIIIIRPQVQKTEDEDLELISKEQVQNFGHRVETHTCNPRTIHVIMRCSSSLQPCKIVLPHHKSLI